jgi:adenylylsulfate reductase, subunit B
MPPTINKNLCTGCGKCVDVCPSDVFCGTEKGEIPVVNYPGECWHEGACVMDCPVQAVSLRIPLPMMVLYK